MRLAGGEGVCERGGVDVAVARRVEPRLDVIHVEQRVKATDLVRPDEPRQRLQPSTTQGTTVYRKL